MYFVRSDQKTNGHFQLHQSCMEIDAASRATSFCYTEECFFFQCNNYMCYLQYFNLLLVLSSTHKLQFKLLYHQQKHALPPLLIFL